MIPYSKIIMFDFDGVLGQTMDDNYLAWKHALGIRGIALNKDDYFVLEGMNTISVARHFLGDLANDSSVVNRTVEAKEDHYLKNNNFALYENVDVILNNLYDDGYKIGIVSGASMKRLKETLDKDLLGLFKAIVTGDKISNGKPHPDPYLTAAREMAVKASLCIAVENAPLGIKSAKGAGMFCIAVTSTLPRKYLLEADIIIDNIQELENILNDSKVTRRA